MHALTVPTCHAITNNPPRHELPEPHICLSNHIINIKPQQKPPPDSPTFHTQLLTCWVSSPASSPRPVPSVVAPQPRALARGASRASASAPPAPAGRPRPCASRSSAAAPGAAPADPAGARRVPPGALWRGWGGERLERPQGMEENDREASDTLIFWFSCPLSPDAFEHFLTWTWLKWG